MIDAHIHLVDSRFDGCRKVLIKQAQNAGIVKFIDPAVATSGFNKLKQLTHDFPSIIPSYGLHPYFIEQHSPNDIQLLDEWLTNNQSCAVGECGLDFFIKNLDKQTQHYYFEAQIELAKKHRLPLILHARSAVETVFQALKNADYFNAMIHSYNGSIQQTQLLLDKGVKFSFGGAICHPNANKLHKLLKYMPTDAIMFETDAPDQNLYPHHKKINKPINLIKIIACYCAITEQELSHVTDKSQSVTKQFFNL